VLVLAIDASTYSGSVALIADGAVLAEAVAAMRGEHEERLMPAISDMLSRNSIALDRVSAVACGAGPGSFTSLRIAASIAKGFCVARNVPLLVAPSALLVVGATEPELAPGSYVVAMDAMRGDFFWHHVEVNVGGNIVPRMSSRTTRSELERHAGENGARIIGPSESPALNPHARGFARLIQAGITTQADMTTWEPNYGRKAEAQVRWEAAHGRELDTV
jgi:tRNA threonylcarbamoyladenosine biosynthesis protein TsaB